VALRSGGNHEKSKIRYILGEQRVILSLPNFGSKGGVIAALKDTDVPILVHAYPDELDKLATSTKRDGVITSLDWNNNYELLVSALGKGCSWGCDVGRIKPMQVTYGGMQTIDGKLECYLGEGQFTAPVREAFERYLGYNVEFLDKQ